MGLVEYLEKNPEVITSVTDPKKRGEYTASVHLSCEECFVNITLASVALAYELHKKDIKWEDYFPLLGTIFERGTLVRILNKEGTTLVEGKYASIVEAAIKKPEYIHPDAIKIFEKHLSEK